MANILETIVEQKRVEVARLPGRTVSTGQLASALQARGDWRDFSGGWVLRRQGCGEQDICWSNRAVACVECTRTAISFAARAASLAFAQLFQKAVHTHQQRGQ